ncbi:hypothetical protein CLIM01_15158 [Colletotrichum limetticola]|uniref:Uncharacterized protein n=1 Tax=Colletotrichum limetticola TaxID=1209924 RepID=A0ABQ9PC85_9PEZI|nr:hypothetical protein CLIM01_15158 [Colletotrichum limetticola]
MNSTAGDRFIAYIISCLCGPLQGKEFVVKVAALLAYLKVRKAPKEYNNGLPGNRTNLLFEFDKALNFNFGNMLITIKVLKQVLMFSARIWEIHAPEDTVHPRTLPATFDLCDDSVSRKMLYMYCCVRILFPNTYEATMHRTRAVFQMSSADTAKLLLDTLSDDELEAGGYSMCDVDEDLFNGEGDESYRSDMSNVKSGEDLDLSEGGRLDDDHGDSNVLDESYGPGAEEDDSDIE